MTTFIEAARSMIGTPFVHQARKPGHGIDCVGLVVCSARIAGYQVDDFVAYGRDPDPATMLRALSTRLIPVEEPTSGVVAYVWFGKRELSTHVGVIDGDHLIHAYAKRSRDRSVSRVVSDPLRRWLPYIHSFWALPA